MNVFLMSWLKMIVLLETPGKHNVETILNYQTKKAHRYISALKFLFSRRTCIDNSVEFLSLANEENNLSKKLASKPKVLL